MTFTRYRVRGTRRYLAAAAVLIVVVVAFMARPTPIPGIDGGTLEASVGGDLISCERHAPEMVALIERARELVDLAGSNGYGRDGLGKTIRDVN